MRLVRLAKALGITGQELRHELELVDFGVKPTDREIPDNLAHGIVRFVARKRNITVDPLFFTEGSDDDSAEQSESQSTVEVVSTPVSYDKNESEADEAPVQRHKETSSSSDQAITGASVHVLRKLTLDNVPKAAVERQKRVTTVKSAAEIRAAKKEQERLAVEEKAAAALERKKNAHVKQEQIKKKDGVVLLPDLVTVKEFAEKTGIQIPKVIAELMKNGVLVTINQTIDFDTASIVANELGVTVSRMESNVDVEHLYSRNLEELLKDEPENLVPRAPVVVVMGHVDHGKTSILDSIRQTEVAKKEAGGITQHIGAYQVLHKSSDGTYPITFLDTPGHEAFTAMRARGAQITDIAIIVVAANEGVKPTTIEAINHAKEADVPMIVAINKMDVEGADPERVKGELAAQGLQAEDWGGSVPMIPCSAHTKQGISTLLDTIILVSQVHEVRANPKRKAIATVVESHIDSSLGAVATLVINTGTLNVAEPFICGSVSGKVRAMMDAHGKRLQSVGPSGAIRISGFSAAPQVGDVLQVVESEQKAKELTSQFAVLHQQNKKVNFADLVSRLSEGKLSQLKIILKTDTQGSLEALRDALAKLQTEETTVKIIHGAIGAVTENDVMMAAASEGIVIAFHSDVSPSIIKLSEREGVSVREYTVVYTLLDDIEGMLKGLIEPEDAETVLGHLEIKQVFLTKKKEQIVGGKVSDGIIKRLPARLLRNGEVIGTGRIVSLKYVDKDIKEAKEGSECGMRLESSVPAEVGDVLEVYLQELKKKI
jgi:translation initiation factor IF-2